MRRALELAQRGVGKTSPNPAVGAVIVRGGRILGEGWHQRAGGPHAEIRAIKAAGAGLRGKPTTLYVTLEPCCTWGRTGPCTEAIIAAGIQRVVIGACDPNPKHNGRGIRALRRAGVEVSTGVLARDATALNESFNHWITTGRPLVIAKAAMSLDGKIATRTGDSQWITTPAARKEGHRLRAQVDAIMVAAGTVRRDDPQLTLRHGIRGRQPWRVVVDGRGRSRLTARLFTDRWRAHTVVVTTDHAPLRWQRRLAARGIKVLVVKAEGEHVDLRSMMNALGALEMTSVLVEGGGDFLGALLEQRLVQRMMLVFAPKIIGGREAVSAVDGRGVGRVEQSITFREGRWQPLAGGQMMFTGKVRA